MLLADAGSVVDVRKVLSCYRPYPRPVIGGDALLAGALTTPGCPCSVRSAACGIASIGLITPCEVGSRSAAEFPHAGSRAGVAPVS